MMRWPVKSPAASDTSHAKGGPMTLGLSIASLAQPDSAPMKGVSVGPPGIRTFTVMPLPANSAAQTAELASSAALVAP